MSATDNLSGLQFLHIESGNEHGLKAIHEDRKIGEMYWNKVSGQRWGQPFEAGQVSDINVDSEFQRRGVGTALWNEGKKYTPAPKHSGVQTEAGRGWAEHIKD